VADRLDISDLLKNKKGPNATEYLTGNQDAAIFLPSISSFYTKSLSKKNLRDGNIPVGLNSFDDFDFLNANTNVFWYPWALYSAGHAELDIKKGQDKERVFHSRDRTATLIVGDSGGYQLSTGVLKGKLSTGAIDDLTIDTKGLRHKIMKWLEHSADYSMILDIPTTSITNTKSIIFKKNFNALPENTVALNSLIANINNDSSLDDKQKTSKINDVKKLIESNPGVCFYDDMGKKDNPILKQTYGQYITANFKLPNSGVMFDDCLEHTKWNCEYFIKHRTVGETKFLNVLQGRNIMVFDNQMQLDYEYYTDDQGNETKRLKQGEGDIWWEAVKKFNDPNALDFEGNPIGDRAFEGWAIPGNLKFDFQMLMKRLKIMYDEGFLTTQSQGGKLRDDVPLLMHFLGISRINAGLLYTTIQQEIRKEINPNFIVTYDAASPFLCTAKGKGYSNFIVNNQKMAFRMDVMPDKNAKELSRMFSHLSENRSGELWENFTFQYIGDKQTYSTHDDTTLGKMITVGDVCYRDGKPTKKKKEETEEQFKARLDAGNYKEQSLWDEMGYSAIMNMNVEQHIKGIQTGLKYYTDPNPEVAKTNLPMKMIEGKAAIEEIIRSKFDPKVMADNMEALNNVLGMTPAEVNSVESSQYIDEDEDELYNVVEDNEVEDENQDTEPSVIQEISFDDLFDEG